jgi:nitronate monooxygenase
MKFKSLAKIPSGILGSKIPIIQGGMGVGISLAGLAGAVANQGGIGVISTAAIGMDEPDFFRNFLEANIRALRKEIRKAREITQGVLGVNIMVAMANFVDMVKVAHRGSGRCHLRGGRAARRPSRAARWEQEDEACSHRVLGKGRADHFKDMARPTWVSSRRGCRGRADGGGHLGFKREQIADPRYALDRLVPEVMRELQPFEEAQGRAIPVVPAGGIYTGGDILKYLELGAAGVQMATRFVTTTECDAPIDFKHAYLEAKREDIVIIDSPVGMPGRAIRNRFIDDVEEGKKKPYTCPYHCLRTCDYEHSPYCIAQALMNAKKGGLEHGFAFVGANAGREREVVSVKELMERLQEEFEAAARPLAAPGVDAE